jgi:hypothetical protein
LFRDKRYLTGAEALLRRLLWQCLGRGTSRLLILKHRCT